ncbi:MAG TPA: hypothetical protein VE326_14670 [Candidatus Binatia bacterium]|nr:hypothetical protein [Candidatus Binatia bacterium]
MARERPAAAARLGNAGAEETEAVSELPDAGPDGELSWSVWPARQKPLTAAVIVAGALVLGILIARGTGDRLLGIAAPLFVLVSLSSYLLPTRYRLTPDAVEVRSLGVVRARPWSEMKRFEEDEAGLFLSPFEKRSWLDAYRGVRLSLGGNRDRVVAFVQARVARSGRR